MRDLNQAQLQLFYLVTSFVQGYEPPELQALIDEDVTEAAAALAATAETASRGVIFEHRSTSLPAERLMSALKPLLQEARTGSSSAFDRDSAVVLRRVEDAARHTRRLDPSNRRAFLDLLGRVTRKRVEPTDAPEAAAGAPRLIIP